MFNDLQKRNNRLPSQKKERIKKVWKYLLAPSNFRLIL